MKKICVVTGTRAEYGLLKPLLCRIKESKEAKLCLIVTGMHLSPEYGLTYREIELDGFLEYEKNEMLLSSDTANGVAKSVGLGIIGFADIYARISPDMVVLLGDRFETFAAASAAMLQGIPIAHIHGGELTEGAVDDAMRHAITKMSTLHFAAAPRYRERIIQMGELPENVYCVGALGVENIKAQKLMEKKELEESILFPLDKPFVLVTYHPVTQERNMAGEQFQNLLDALSALSYKVIFTKANADAEGRVINSMIDRYTAEHSQSTVAFTSLGMVRYLSALRFCRMVIGNSSSGIIEAPSFGVPTVNIGLRQQGRERADSVIDCGNGVNDIFLAVQKAEELYGQRKLEMVKNPYEGEKTSKKIFQYILEFLMKNTSMQKKFFDLP